MKQLTLDDVFERIGDLQSSVAQILQVVLHAIAEKQALQVQLPAPEYLTREETATVCKRSPRTIQNYVKRGLLQEFHPSPGSPPLYRRDQVIRCIEGCQARPVPKIPPEQRALLLLTKLEGQEK